MERKAALGKRKTNVASFTSLLKATLPLDLVESLPDQFPGISSEHSPLQRLIHSHHLGPPPSAHSGAPNHPSAKRNSSFVPPCLSEKAALMG